MVYNMVLDRVCFMIRTVIHMNMMVRGLMIGAAVMAEAGWYRDDVLNGLVISSR